MLKKLVVGLVSMLAFSMAAADEGKVQAPREPVQLTDTELDQITAGGVLAIIIVTPGKGSHQSIGTEPSIFIIGQGKGTIPFHAIIK